MYFSSKLEKSVPFTVVAAMVRLTMTDQPTFSAMTVLCNLH